MKLYQQQKEQKHLKQQPPKPMRHLPNQFRHRDRGIHPGRTKGG